MATGVFVKPVARPTATPPRFLRPAGTRQPLPCVHLGGATGDTVRCQSCAGSVRLKLVACAVHDRCTTTKAVSGTACCVGCRSYRPNTGSLIAPLGCRGQETPWTGAAAKKPWHYRVTVAIPHLDTLESLRVIIDLYRQQTTPAYVIVVDTGSPTIVCAELEKMRDVDLEVHYVRAHGYVHSSAPVSTALDVAQALCRTPYLLHTHADVFPRRRDLLAWLIGQCDEATPVVGWQMSPRANSPRWHGTVSHTCTLLHMPTIRRIGASWSMERWYEKNGVPAHVTYGWPDTESTFRDCLDAAGIAPRLLGEEVNFERQQTEWWDHARSLPGLRAYAPGSDLHRQAERYAAAALADAKQRVSLW